MRALRTVFMLTAVLAALAHSAATMNRPYALRNRNDLAIDHATGGITASETRLYIGTDTGTIEERTLDGILMGGYGTYITSSGTSNFSSTTNRMAGFTQLALGVANDVFYFCSEDDNAVFRFDTQTNAITRMAGDGTAGMTGTSPQTGTNARIDCGTTAVSATRNDARSRVYIYSGDATAGGNYHGILVLQATASSGADSGILTLLVGSGIPGHADGQGAAAQLVGVYSMVFWRHVETNNEYLIVVGADSAAPIRYVSILDSTMHSAAITYSSTGNIRSGIDAAATMPSPLGLIGMPLKPYAYGTTSTRAFTLSWQPNLASFNIQFNPTPLSGKWGAAITPSGRHTFIGSATPGNGTIVRFTMDTITETITPAPTHTRSATITPPSKTHPRTRSHTVVPTPTIPLTPVPPTTTKAAPTPVPPPTPAPNAPNGPGTPSGPSGPVGEPQSAIPLTTIPASENTGGNGVNHAAHTSVAALLAICGSAAFLMQ